MATLNLSPQSGRATGAVKLDGLVIDERLRPFLPEDLLGTWDRTAPVEVRLDLNAEFAWRPDAANPLSVEGRLRARGGSLGPDYAPWNVRNLNADVDIADTEMEVTRLRMLFGGAVVSGSARGSVTPEMTPLGHAIFRATGLELDRDLRALLPPDMQRTWDRLGPKGEMDLLLEAARRTPAAAPSLYARATLTQCALELPEAAAPLTDVGGVLEYRDGLVKTRALRGKVAGGAFEVTDAAVALAEPDRFRLAVTVQGVDLDRNVGDLLPEAVRASLGDRPRAFAADLHATGELAGTFDLARSGTGDPMTYEGTATLSRATITQPALGHPFQDGEIAVSFDPHGLEIDTLEGRWGDARVRVEPVRFVYDPEARQACVLRVTQMPMDEAFWNIIGPRTALELKKYDPTGILDVRLELAFPAEGAAPFDVAADADVREGSATYRGFPYPLSGLEGELRIEKRRVRNASFKGRHDGTQVHVGIETEEAEASPRYTVTVRARDGRFDEALYKALPENLREAWDVLKPEGALSAVYENRMRLRPGRRPASTVSLDLEFPELSLDLGERTTFRQARLRIAEIRTDPEKGVSYHGEAATGAAEVFGLSLENAAGRFHAIDGGVAIEQARGDFYGGELSGSARVAFRGDEAQPAGVVGRFNLVHADAGRVADVIGAEDVRGRLDAAGAFDARVGQGDGLALRGAATIRDGRIGRIPGLLNVLRVFHLRRPTPDFHELRLACAYEKGNLKAGRAELLGDLLTLYGSGALYADGRLEGRFRPEFMDEESVLVVGDIAKWMKQTFMPIVLEGSVEKPVWRVDAPLTPGSLFTRVFGGIGLFGLEGAGRPDTPARE
jgi:hypothetical protein